MSNLRSFKVSTWRNGSEKVSNHSFGIRIRKEDFESIKNWTEINVDKNYIVKKPSTKFTKKCPEIRSVIIRDFLIKNNLNSWKPYKPNQLQLCEIEENKFELKTI